MSYTLVFLTVAWLGAVFLAFAQRNMYRDDGPLMFFTVIMTGITGGIVCGAWL